MLNIFLLIVSSVRFWIIKRCLFIFSWGFCWVFKLFTTDLFVYTRDYGHRCHQPFACLGKTNCRTSNYLDVKICMYIWWWWWYMEVFSKSWGYPNWSSKFLVIWLENPWFGVASSFRKPPRAIHQQAPAEGFFRQSLPAEYPEDPWIIWGSPKTYILYSYIYIHYIYILLPSSEKAPRQISGQHGLTHSSGLSSSICQLLRKGSNFQAPPVSKTHPLSQKESR